MAKPANSRKILVIDALPEVQEWVDRFVEHARTGDLPGWPSHTHGEMPIIAITVAALWRNIDMSLEGANIDWSVARNGLPPFPGGGKGVKASVFQRLSVDELIVQKDPDPHREGTSWWHCFLHSCGINHN